MKSELKKISNYDDLKNWWINNYQKLGIEDFVIDGAINPKIYEKEEIKILIFQLETYGYNECGITFMSNEMENWLKDAKKTNRNTAVFVHFLFEYIKLFKQGKTPPDFLEDDFKSVYQDVDILIEAMNKVACINIRKTSNENINADYESIDKEKDIELLQKQIELLNPQIIVTGGIPVKNALLEFDEYKNSEFEIGSVYNINTKIVATLNHFSRASYGDLYDKAFDIAKALSINNL